jgi:hypothetical protein
LRTKLLGKFNIYQMGVETKDGTPSRLSCKKIMRGGTCTLLTDEMYTELPSESLELLNFIAKRNEGKKKSSRTWGVYGRPDFADFLLDQTLREDDDKKIKAA